MGSSARDALYAGLISGTSIDGIDAALVRLGEHRCELVATRSHPYPDALRRDLLAAIESPDSTGADAIGRLDVAIGHEFKDAAIALVRSAGLRSADVRAVGSHGQTLRHSPTGTAFTLQIGDPNIIAEGTGITTVADFRRRDVAVGGQGAPLAPAFHHWLWAKERSRPVILNLGGIANITVLHEDPARVTGFDTGPANTLMDAWIRRHRHEPMDRDGRWAASGTLDARLLETLLADTYFAAAPPKSTGFEYFNLDWLDRRIGARQLEPVDIQATLLALTVQSVAGAVTRSAAGADEVIVCGGGVHNRALMAGLAAALAPVRVRSSASAGLDPDWVEAAAFGWLAARTLAGQTGNLPSVTGARRAVVLGGIYAAGG